ncbi:MAG: Type 1 glutamine amidotransferase-like domain-containing protein [Acidimicrobiia bacterium]|nr:Type 1 glutamine amidotransferase-like domain-containing protein [Acidimicrobiia bacterium]MBP8180645.1 Type 1 glutamine amidotransferase-like domain-containing protein [Acidimicrobiia bacterium]
MRGTDSSGRLVLGGGNLLDPAARPTLRGVLGLNDGPHNDGPDKVRTGSTVALVPAAAAFEGIQAAVDEATAVLGELGFVVDVIAASHHSDFGSDELERIANASAVWIADGSALHLRSILVDTQIAGTLAGVIAAGGVVIADGAGAEVLCDPMIDPRGGAFTVGLGLIRDCTVITDIESFPDQRRARSIDMVGPERWLVGIPGHSAWTFQPGAGWTETGAAPVVVLAGPGLGAPATWAESAAIHGLFGQLVALEEPRTA